MPGLPGLLRTRRSGVSNGLIRMLPAEATHQPPPPAARHDHATLAPAQLPG